MKIILASGNQGKIREIASYCTRHDVLPYTDIVEKFDVVEDGTTFKANALLKAHAVYKRVKDRVGGAFVVLSDDSGISVPALGNVPGIYSARYAGEAASDKENLQKLIDTLKERGIARTPAYYTAAMAIVTERGDFTVHGWMHGDVIAQAKGERGFGYDPMFIPEGYEETLGELEGSVKEKLSHRSKALQLAKYVIETLE